jgi:hypothetical protein
MMRDNQNPVVTMSDPADIEPEIMTGFLIRIIYQRMGDYCIQRWPMKNAEGCMTY